jgi:hypothetical protein
MNFYNPGTFFFRSTSVNDALFQCFDGGFMFFNDYCGHVPSRLVKHKFHNGGMDDSFILRSET